MLCKLVHTIKERSSNRERQKSLWALRQQMINLFTNGTATVMTGWKKILIFDSPTVGFMVELYDQYIQESCTTLTLYQNQTCSKQYLSLLIPEYYLSPHLSMAIS